MKSIATILALTDLSAFSRHATARAAMLASEGGARLELLHVLEGGMLEQLRALLGSKATTVTEHLLEAAHDELAQLAAATCQPRGVSPGLHLASGTPLSEILNRIDAYDAGLTVLGAHGAGFLRHLLLGSTAERLLHKVVRPLLVVRQVPHEPYRRLLVAVDFSSCSLAAIRLARTLAPEAELLLFNAFEVPFEGKLHFAGVSEEKIQHYRNAAQKEAGRGLEAIAAEAGLTSAQFRRIVTHGDAALRILEQEQEQDIDLIVIGKHGKGVAEELLLGSTTKYVLAQSTCDVLVTRG